MPQSYTIIRSGVKTQMCAHVHDRSYQPLISTYRKPIQLVSRVNIDKTERSLVEGSSNSLQQLHVPKVSNHLATESNTNECFHRVLMFLVRSLVSPRLGRSTSLASSARLGPTSLPLTTASPCRLHLSHYYFEELFDDRHLAWFANTSHLAPLFGWLKDVAKRPIPARRIS